MKPTLRPFFYTVRVAKRQAQEWEVALQLLFTMLLQKAGEVIMRL